jgi:hypothetical protein
MASAIFHLAIPSKDLVASKNFYNGVLEAAVGREYSNYIIFNFFGHQLVCHLDPEKVDKEVQMYPRHFGIILDDSLKFQQVYENSKKKNAHFFEELFERFQNKPGWHSSFFLVDPSNNLIEFKHYKNQTDITN